MPDPSWKPRTGRYGARDPKKDRAALDRACSAACRRLEMPEVNLSYFPPPAKVRWRASGVVAQRSIAEGDGGSADEAIAAQPSNIASAFAVRITAAMRAIGGGQLEQLSQSRKSRYGGTLAHSCAVVIRGKLPSALTGGPTMARLMAGR